MERHSRWGKWHKKYLESVMGVTSSVAVRCDFFEVED